MGKKLLVGLMVVFGWLALASCGGSSGSTAPAEEGGTAVAGTGALEVAEKVSVVDAQTSASSNLAKSVKALKVDFANAAKAIPTDPNSDYVKDATITYVSERSAESFSRVNEILCSLDQSRYVDMVNEGDYIAKIDTTQCAQDKDSAKGAGEDSQNQSTGSNATTYEDWTVNSSRAENQPHIIKVWIHEKAKNMGPFSDPAKTIYIGVTITEGKSDTNKLGLFTAYFKACSDGDLVCETPLMRGLLKTVKDANNKVMLNFLVTGGMGEFTFEEKASLYKSLDGTTGEGSASMTDFDEHEGAVSKAFNFSNNATYFYRSDTDGSNAVCMSRENPVTNVWRYGLYNSAGARVARSNPGFPVRFTSGDRDYFGFAGYYGIGFPPDVTLPSGSTVYKQTFSSSSDSITETPYTVFVASGRLQKHVKKDTTLGKIKNVSLSWNKCEDQGQGQWSCSDYRVKWNGTQLIKDGIRSQSTNWMWKDLTAEPVTFAQNDFSFNFYSESLGGDGRIDLMIPNTLHDWNDPDSLPIKQIAVSDLTDATLVIFHRISTVYPGETVPATLACLENCIDPAKIDTQDPHFTNSSYKGGNENFNVTNMNTAPGSLVAGTNYIAYTFDTDLAHENAMVLKYGGDPVVLSSNSNQQNGVWGGSLFEMNTANKAALECDLPPGSPPQAVAGTCGWKVWDLDTFYTWETGANEWNKLTALLDADSVPVAFSPPLMVEYTLAATGAKYFLEYNGFGDLWGIPGKCVNADTGLDAPCYTEEGDKRNIRWVPGFSIAAGETVIDVDDNSITYYVKPLEQEEQMVSVGAATCASAGLSLTGYDLPDASLVQDPGIGSEPTLNVPTRVIGGVVQP